MADIEFGGERFTISDSIGLMALLRFAHVAKAGTDSNDLAGLAAMYDLLEQCFPAEEFDRFQTVALRTKAKGDEIMAVVTKAIEAMSARPTEPPSVSSAGPTIIAPSSEVDSYSRVIAREEASGRPDRALMVLLAQETSAA